jgi:septal ring factor EnvC (AmiA/AmiB activator)
MRGNLLFLLFHHLIIAHGENYYSVYAHIEELFKTKGDEVEKDEVIATVGDTGSMAGSGLYFELRHHGKPMNPLEWLNLGGYRLSDK